MKYCQHLHACLNKVKNSYYALLCYALYSTLLCSPLLSSGLLSSPLLFSTLLYSNLLSYTTPYYPIHMHFKRTLGTLLLLKAVLAVLVLHVYAGVIGWPELGESASAENFYSP